MFSEKIRKKAIQIENENVKSWRQNGKPGLGERRDVPRFGGWEKRKENKTYVAG